MNDDSIGLNEYGILVSMLSRGKIRKKVRSGEVSESDTTETGFFVSDVVDDSYCMRTNPDLQLYPSFASAQDVIKTAKALGPFLYTPETQRISIADGVNVKEEFRKYAPRGEGERHFDLVYEMVLSEAEKFREKGYQPPLIVPTNRFNTGKLYPLDRKKSVEPDALMIIRDRRAIRDYGYCNTAAIEVQRTDFQPLEGKMRKYRDLFIKGKAIYVVLAVSSGVKGNVEEFKKRMNLLGFSESSYEIRRI